MSETFSEFYVRLMLGYVWKHEKTIDIHLEQFKQTPQSYQESLRTIQQISTTSLGNPYARRHHVLNSLNAHIYIYIYIFTYTICGPVVPSLLGQYGGRSGFKMRGRRFYIQPVGRYDLNNAWVALLYTTVGPLVRASAGSRVAPVWICMRCFGCASRIACCVYGWANRIRIRN